MFYCGDNTEVVLTAVGFSHTTCTCQGSLLSIPFTAYRVYHIPYAGIFKFFVCTVSSSKIDMNVSKFEFYGII